MDFYCRRVYAARVVCGRSCMMDCDDLAGSVKTFASALLSAFPVWGLFVLVLVLVWLAKPCCC